jgi:hypothetical protein
VSEKETEQARSAAIEEWSKVMPHLRYALAEGKHYEAYSTAENLVESLHQVAESVISPAVDLMCFAAEHVVDTIAELIRLNLTATNRNI